MKTKKIGVAALAAILSACGVLAVAQEQRSPTEQSPAPQSQPSQPGMMGGGMMGGGMMGQMRAHHQQMMELMDKLMQSMTALEAAKDQATLKAKLAEHRALLEQMHSQMMQQGGMMQQMQHMQMPANPGNTPAPASK